MRTLLAPVLALALILQGGSAAAQFSLFNLRNSLVQFALDKLSVPGSFEIEAEGVERDEDGFTELVGVTIADSEGVWLQADALILSWNASRVLRGQLVINRLGARGVDVLRAPNPASLPEPEAEVAEEVEEPPAQAGLFGFDWPRAPITTIIEELVLDDVEIAPGVIAEQGVAFDATGSARDIGAIQAVDLTVQRNDALEGEIFLDYLRNFETNQLTVDLEATEEAGGLVASILGLPEESASQVSIYADGPLDDWRLALRAEGEDLLDVQAQAEIDLTAPVGVALTATVTPGAALEPEVAAAISPFARVVLLAEEGEDGRIVIEDALIEAPGIDFAAEGYYERPTGAVSLDLALLAEEGISDLVGGVDFDRFGFEGQARGALDDLTAEGELTLAGLRTEAVDVGDAALQATISRAGERIGFDVAGEVSGLRLDRLAPETVGAVELAAVGAYDGATLSLERFVFDSPLLTAEAEGVVGASPAPEAGEQEGPTALTYALRAPELRPIAEAYDIEASGGAAIEGRASGPLDAPRLVGEAALRDVTYQGETYGTVALEHDVTLGATPEGRVALTASGSPYGPAEVTASFRLEDQLLTLSEFEAEAVGAALEGELALALDSYLADGRVAFRIVDLATLEAQAGLALEGDASGVVLLEAVEGEQTVAVEAAGSNVRGFDYALESFAIDATVRRALTAPQGEGVFTLTNLEGPDAAAASVRFEGEAALVEEALVAEGVLTAEALAAAGATIDALRLEGTGTDLLAAPAVEAALTVDGVAYPEAEARVARLTFEGAARDLATSPAAEGVLTVTGIEAAGATVGAVTATVEGRSLIEEPAVELAVTALDLAYPPAEAEIGVVRFEGSASDLYGAASAQGVLTADAVAAGEATGGGLRLEFEGESLLEDPVVEASLALENLAYPPAEARIGALSFEGTARDLYTAPSAEGVLTAEGVEAAEARIGALTARFDGETLIENPTLDLALEAEDVAYPPADARVASLTFEGSASDLLTSPNAQGELAARGIAAAGAEVGALEARFEGEDLLDAPSGTFEATISDVAAAGFRTPQARLEATARQAGGGLAVDAEATAGPIAGEGVALGGVTLDATVADALSPTPRIDAEARATDVEAAGYEVASLAATAEGPLSALDLAVDATGTTAAGEPLDLGLRARADLAGEEISAEVTALDARAGTLEARLGRSARITLGEATGIEDLQLEILGGTVEGDVALYPTGLVGDLAVLLPRLEPVGELAGLPVDSGSLTATAVFDTRPGTAGADVDIAVNDLVPEAIEDVPGGLDIVAQADWNGDRVVAEAAVTGPFERPVLAEFALPLRPTGGLIPAPPDPAPIEGSLRWAGRLGDLWALVPVPDLILDGDARIALAFDGTLDAPEIAGDVALTDGTAQYLTTGTILTDFTITSALMPGGAFRVSARATDGAGSPVTAEVVISGGAIDAEVAAREAVLVRRDDVTASITAGLDIEGPLVAPAIRGDVFINRAEVRLVDATPPSVATLGEVRLIGDPRVEEEDAEGEGAIPLDIEVGGEEIYVRGRGLDSQWRLELDVGGSASQPILVGAVEAVRGRLSLIGFPFDLTRGRVIFDGGAEIDPRLDVALFRENDGVIGGLVVSGYASEPQLGFESTPALPESEVLPRVLFGTTTQSLSTGQAIQLAAGIATLLGGGGGPVDAVRAATGLDVLRFDQEGGQAGVTVGRNISDDVFVGARQPIEGGSATVRVEIEVFDNVTVDTELGVEAGSSVGLSWKKDF